MTLAEALLADRELATEISPRYVDDEMLIRARAAASRHNARLDAPGLAIKSRTNPKPHGWEARARGVRIDEDQQRHPWEVVGKGESDVEALEALIAQLDAKPVIASATATCPTCGQGLPG